MLLYFQYKWILCISGDHPVEKTTLQKSCILQLDFASVASTTKFFSIESFCIVNLSLWQTLQIPWSPSKGTSCTLLSTINRNDISMPFTCYNSLLRRTYIWHQLPGFLEIKKMMQCCYNFCSKNEISLEYFIAKQYIKYYLYLSQLGTTSNSFTLSSCCKLLFWYFKSV